jgi:hypothetical protein
MTSELTGPWLKMHRSLGPFITPEVSGHILSSADFITTTFGFRFSVHTTIRMATPLRNIPAYPNDAKADHQNFPPFTSEPTHEK